MKKIIRHTKKLQHVLGTAQYINAKTNEIETFNVINSTEKDFNFQKVWLGHLLSAINCLGSKKVKILSWMLEVKDSENKILATHDKIAKSCHVSRPIISKTIKQLIEVNALTKIQQGVYQLNPSLIFKGAHSSRMKVLLTYNLK